MSNINYRHYAERVYEQAAYNPEIDHTNFDEIISYSDEIAALILVDEESLRQEVIYIAQMNIMESF
jgi:predicted DNA-binding protein (UPF0251 family)